MPIDSDTRQSKPPSFFLASLLRHVLFPASYGLSIFLAYTLIRSDLPGWQASIIMLGSLALQFSLIEFFFPLHRAWTKWQDDSKLDALVYGSILATSPFFKSGLILGVTYTFTALQIDSPEWWPTHWHFALQAGFAVLLGEFFTYWVHRIMHETPGWLWRVHTVHHDVRRIYWFNGGRVHPVNVLLVNVARLIPLVLIGAPDDILVMMGFLATIAGFISHLNSTILPGPLNYIVNTHVLHGWHHHQELKKANTNYGSILIVWDIVFGSFYLPSETIADNELGLASDKKLPLQFIPLLLYPFMKQSKPIPSTTSSQE